MDARIEGRVGAHDGVDRQGAGQNGGGGIAFGGDQAGQRQGGRDLRAVEQRQTFLGAKLDGLGLSRSQRIGPVHALALHGRRALADQHEAHMGEGRQIAGGADRALAGNDRQNVGIEEGDKRIDGFERNAGCAAREA